mmetsp:Transcript_12060/g.26290  ORF Transcript_12060/g.26290 Transcript_12060/m.26290 type:complete len:488 (+) Transcript_12060:177-1640(+)
MVRWGWEPSLCTAASSQLWLFFVLFLHVLRSCCAQNYTLMDYLDPENMPSWCKDCATPTYLQDLRRSTAANPYASANWMMLAIWSMASGDVELAYFSIEVARRVSSLLGQDMEEQANDNMRRLEEAYPVAVTYRMTRSATLWQPESTVVQEGLTRLFLPVATSLDGKPRLTPQQLSLFTEALAETQDHIPKPIELIPRKMLGLPGLKRAAMLRRCWRTGYFNESIESIASRQFEAYFPSSMYKRLTYVGNYKVGSISQRDFLQRDAAGQAPFVLGRRAFPGHTWFTFARDPLSRIVSVFFEAHGWLCNVCQDDVEQPEGQERPTTYEIFNPGPGAGKLFCRYGMNPWMADLGNKAHRAAVMERFEAMIACIEDGSWEFFMVNPQVERLLLWPEQGGSVDFIGLVSHMSRDWADLSAIQKAAYNIDLDPVGLPPRVHVTKQSLYSLVNVTSMPAQLAKRICYFYRRDYCCMDLPIPRICRGVVDCKGV